MQYWLDTSETVPKGVGFSHFDALHLAWMGVFILFTLASCRFYQRRPRDRERMRKSYALTIAADEVFLIACLLLGGNFTPDYLPLHLCSINIFLILWHAWHPGPVLDNFLYAICIPGALMALLFPSWTKVPLLNFMHIHSFTLHILLAAYPIMLTAGGDIRPDPRKLPKCVALLAFLAGIALVFNLIFDTNFMFLMSAPKGNPLRWFQDHFGSHLIGFAVLLPLVLLLMYTPVLLHRRDHKPAQA